MSEYNQTIADSVWEPLTKQTYLDWYQQSIESPDAFWSEQAKRFINWDKPWDTVREENLREGEITWFKGAQLNVSYNCIDRHLEQHADKTAIIWEPDSPDDTTQTITYQQLHDKTCQIANVLKAHGIKKGTRVCIYLPMIPEAAMCMLACARIGAVHSVVFAGFSSASLKNRIEDAQAQMVITADGLIRGGKHLDTKGQVDEALKGVDCVKTVLVMKHCHTKVTMHDRDHWLQEEMDKQATSCPPEKMDAEDPLFILYTSGSTGKPKGVLHTQGGYITYAAMTFRYVFDYQPKDIYWCTADVGWITGHTYMVYGPLAMGATNVMYEGVPNYPTPSRCWQIIDKHNVTIFYTAPTAIRALMAQGNEHVNSTSRDSLRVLGTVGEPINPEAWRWYHDVVGKAKLPIVDTWWQTETGGIMIAPLINISKQNPGSAGLPFFGVKPQCVDAQGKQTKPNEKGRLAIMQSWPGMARTIYRDHPRYMKQYLSEIPGAYFTGDGCYQDDQGEFWITGRVDDVINVSGHRLGTAEIESALVSHPDVAEAAVVGIPDEIKGQEIYAFVTLNDGVKFNQALSEELRQAVVTDIGKIARPKQIQWAPSLPKTRSGKIMRRVLRLIAQDVFDELGDLSTLADQSVVENLISGKKAMQTTTT